MRRTAVGGIRVRLVEKAKAQRRIVETGLQILRDVETGAEAGWGADSLDIAWVEAGKVMPIKEPALAVATGRCRVRVESLADVQGEPESFCVTCQLPGAGSLIFVRELSDVAVVSRGEGKLVVVPSRLLGGFVLRLVEPEPQTDEAADVQILGRDGSPDDGPVTMPAPPRVGWEADLERELDAPLIEACGFLNESECSCFSNGAVQLLRGASSSVAKLFEMPDDAVSEAERLLRSLLLRATDGTTSTDELAELLGFPAGKRDDAVEFVMRLFSRPGRWLERELLFVDRSSETADHWLMFQARVTTYGRMFGIADRLAVVRSPTDDFLLINSTDLGVPLELERCYTVDGGLFAFAGCVVYQGRGSSRVDGHTTAIVPSRAGHWDWKSDNATRDCRDVDVRRIFRAEFPAMRAIIILFSRVWAPVFWNDDDGPGVVSALLEAASNGDCDAILAMIDAGVNPSWADPSGVTALHRAAEEGHESTVSLLLSTGRVHVDQATRDGVTPLILAAARGQLEVVSTLIAAGADLAHTDSNLHNALSEAVLAGQCDVVDQLLLWDADPNFVMANGRSLLIVAAIDGALSIVDALIEAGADVEFVDGLGRTAIHVGAHYGHEAVVRRLIEAGAEKESSTVGGETPLIAAVKRGHLNVVNALVAAGADVNRGMGGMSLLRIAIRACRSAVVDRLHDLGARGADAAAEEAEEEEWRDDQRYDG